MESEFSVAMISVISGWDGATIMGFTIAVTLKANVTFDVPPEPVAVTVQLRCVCTCVGVPEIVPEFALKLNPEGSVGEIEYPFALIAPPEFIGVATKIEFPTVTDCTELDNVIEGAAT